MVNILKNAALSACVAFTFAAAPALSATSDSEKSEIRTELQVAMQRHLDRNLVDGAMISVDFEKGGVTRLYPTTAHPMVLIGDGFYVLCSDLADEAGNTLDVDFYMSESTRGFKVFRTEINNRDILKALMGKGGVAEF